MVLEFEPAIDGTEHHTYWLGSSSNQSRTSELRRPGRGGDRIWGFGFHHASGPRLDRIEPPGGRTRPHAITDVGATVGEPEHEPGRRSTWNIPRRLAAQPVGAEHARCRSHHHLGGQGPQ
jgi:hypothetical protein